MGGQREPNPGCVSICSRISEVFVDDVPMERNQVLLSVGRHYYAFDKACTAHLDAMLETPAAALIEATADPTRTFEFVRASMSSASWGLTVASPRLGSTRRRRKGIFSDR